MIQHAIIKHSKRSLPSLCIGDTTKCMHCCTTFASRVSLLAHLGDMRVRSKVRGTCCGKPFLENLPPLLPTDVADMLNARDKDLRKAALKQGHTHVISRVPAKQGAHSSTKGIPSHLLPQLTVDGVRRRLAVKTPSVIGKLRFFRRNVIVRTERSVSRRLTKKSTVVCRVRSDDSVIVFPVSRRVKARIETHDERSLLQVAAETAAA